MYLGYNTNGFAHHRLEQAIEIIADLGYKGVAITLDYHALNPFDSDISKHWPGSSNVVSNLGCER